EASASGPASGEVTITLSETEAAITIDGVPYRDGTPVTLASLPAGDHTIKAALFGFRPLEEKFTAVAGEPLSLEFKMKRAHIVTTLKANVLGAEVYVEGKKVGSTPMRLKKRFDQSFAYRFSKAGFEDFNGTVKPTDWVYESGVYRLLLDVTLVATVQTPPAN
ncbi:MAG: PEGA domain-containing protein, partial [Deltaproteobacteria bacterium]|nr:PEGA domain-containing protein [Deltaproteobacteria bacterium]